jgi:hypothetical protein
VDLLLLRIMLENSVRMRTPSRRWLQWLHILFTTIFGLVLPFICWGAEATPGHTHPRAHFVFLPPPAQSANVIGQEIANAHDLIHATTTALANGVGELCAAPLPGAMSPSSTPVSQSYPLVLAVTILLLSALSGQAIPLRRDRDGFQLRAAVLHRFMPPLVIGTPPPR